MFRARDLWDFLFVLKVDEEHRRGGLCGIFCFESGQRAS